MKKFALVFAALSLVLTIGLWKDTLYAQAYANPVFSMYNASVVEKEKTKGCKLHKAATTADLVLFDDGSWAMTGPISAVGTWAQTSSRDIWLSPTRMTDLLSVVDARASASCATPSKSVMPTVLIKKMKLTLNPHGNGTFSLKLKGFDDNGKSFSYSYTIKGTVIQP